MVEIMPLGDNLRMMWLPLSQMYVLPEVRDCWRSVGWLKRASFTNSCSPRKPGVSLRPATTRSCDVDWLNRRSEWYWRRRNSLGLLGERMKEVGKKSTVVDGVKGRVVPMCVEIFHMGCDDTMGGDHDAAAFVTSALETTTMTSKRQRIGHDIFFTREITWFRK